MADRMRNVRTLPIHNMPRLSQLNNSKGAKVHATNPLRGIADIDAHGP